MKQYYSALLLTISLTLTACFGGSSSEPTRYYTLATESINSPNAKNQEFFERSLNIRRFTIEPAYQRTNIVYRESAYDFMFYDLDLWASRPEHMVTQMVSEYMSKSGIFKSVSSKSEVKPDYEFTGNITALEELDENDTQYAHLSVQMSLIKIGSNATLWSKTFDEKAETSDREPRTTAKAISKLLAKYMQQAVNEISEIK